MNRFEKLEEFGKVIARATFIVANDLSFTLNDTARMFDAEYRLYAVSNGAFCRAFSDVAKQISYTRKNSTADTYCSLAKEAIEMLASGKAESDVLCYFDEMLMRGRGEIK